MKFIQQAVGLLALFWWSMGIVKAQKGSDHHTAIIDTTKQQNKLTENEKSKIQINGYVDIAYVWGQTGTAPQINDLGDTILVHGKRDYTSFPLYANQFSMPYSYFQISYQYSDKLRARFALHAGHIVESLYAEELQSLRYVREASIYYQFSDKFNVEAGIFPSLFGFEILILKENLHATRAYIADFAPDYEMGVRLGYNFTERLSMRAMVLNGWQEIRNGNGNPGFALLLQYDAPKNMFLNWGIYFGDEGQVGGKSAWRLYHNIFAKLYLGNRWIVAPMLDFGWEQRKTIKNGGEMQTISFYAPALSIRYALAAHWGVAARWDRVYDPQGLIPELTTHSPNGWQSDSFTLTFEYLPLPQITFRTEGRYGWNKDAVFRDADNLPTNKDYFALVSAAVQF
ncbi:MAG TPA: hypothetical protein DCM08_13425 [Microscillaceae bacterium]|jgi:hypothetical protein|nr:hypothetical protein [Microscillaceae bacterium]